MRTKDIQDFKDCIEIVHNAKQTLNDTCQKLSLVPKDNTMNTSELANALCSHSISDLPYVGVNVEEAFTSRTTAGGVDIVDDSIAEITSIQGNTVRCENLLIIDDVAERTLNGITYSSKNGVIKRKGTATVSFTIFIPLKNTLNLNGSYTLKPFNNVARNDYLTLRDSDNQIAGGEVMVLSPLDNYKLLNIDSNFEAIKIGISFVQDAVYNNENLKPMLVSGTIEPTTFQPYFTGLKNSKLTSLISTNANGEVVDTITPNLEFGKWNNVYKATQLLNTCTLTYTENAELSYVKNGEFDYTFNGTTTKINYFNFVLPSNLPNDSYTLKLFVDGTIAGTKYLRYGANNTMTFGATTVLGTGNVYKIDNSIGVITLQFQANSTLTNYRVKIMLVEGTTIPTVYLPYTDKPYVLDSQGNEVDLGTLEWNYDIGNVHFKTSIDNFIGGNQRMAILLCPGYECKQNNESYDINWDMVIYNGSAKNIHFHNHKFTDAATFKNAMSGVILRYQTADHTYTPLDTNLQYKAHNKGTETAENENAIYGAIPTTTIEYIKKGSTE